MITTPPLAWRLGQIVPSSNTTMETEIPALFRAREGLLPERFTFHSSRMRMKQVTPQELEAMDRDSDRCALELSDARVDVLAYACLVAIMNMGHGYHRRAEARLHARTLENGAPAPVVTSAGALADGLRALDAKRVSIICPYMKPLAQIVVDYIEAEGINVHDHVALEIADNLEVGRRNPENLLEIVQRVDSRGIDALVISACVQMPSLPVIDRVERLLGIPVVSAAVCTAHQMMIRLGLEASSPRAGALLSGRYGRAPNAMNA
jgi:maleate isomerase